MSRRRRVWGLVIRHLFSFPRELEVLAEAFWWPSFDLFIWGLMTVYLESQHGLPAFFIKFFVGAIVLWMFVYRSQQEMGLVFLREVWDRNLLNMLATPLTIWEFFAGTIILGFIKLTISAIWMIVLSHFLYKFNIFTLGILLIPFILNLFMMGWSSGFLINGLVIRFGYRIQAFVWTLILALQPFSAVFYPVSAMPRWMQIVAKFLPLSYIFEGMREVFTRGKMNSWNLVTAFGMNVVYLLLSVIFFQRCFAAAKKSGMIVKFS